MTVVQAYRNLTGKRAIPKDRQFWTLCGPMADADGDLQPNCELNHILRSGLISRASQFYGVERDKRIHEANIRAVRLAKIRPKLHFGEMHTVLAVALQRGDLCPAIVNLDTYHEPTKAARLLGMVLHLLNHVPGPTMVVLNVVVDAAWRGRRHSLDALTKAVQSDLFCMAQLEHGWVDSEVGYFYNGISNYKMGTAIFFQPYKEPALLAG